MCACDVCMCVHVGKRWIFGCGCMHWLDSGRSKIFQRDGGGATRSWGHQSIIFAIFPPKSALAWKQLGRAGTGARTPPPPPPPPQSANGSGLVTHLFVVELGWVHPDDHDAISRRECALEALQFRQDVDTVDTAVREEIQDDDSTGQIAPRR